MPRAEFVLPKGYPDSVTSDYLPYQLWAVPSHVFGWLSVSLATSSLLKALGASPGAAGVAASAAAIKWITKDGIGAAGKLLVRLSTFKLPYCWKAGGFCVCLLHFPSCTWLTKEELSICQVRRWHCRSWALVSLFS